MIYDCFSFFNELDLLEIRLNVLKDVVDKFVLVEATRTHTGKPKPLYYEENKARYAAFTDRIVHIVVDDLMDEIAVAADRGSRPFVNENRQRNALANALTCVNDDDILLLSDLDEMPRPESISTYLTAARSGEIVRFEQRVFMYFLNFRSYCYPWWTIGTQMLSVRTFRHDKCFLEFRCNRFVQESVNTGSTMTKVRFLTPTVMVRDGGWHFTYMGDANSIEKKLGAIAECEVQKLIPLIQRRRNQGKNIFGGLSDCFAVPLDSSFPKYIVDNVVRYSHLIFTVDDAYLRRTSVARRYAYLRGALYRFCARIVPGFLVKPLSKVRSLLRLR